MPCELIHANGQRLKAIVQEQAQCAYNNPAFSAWLERQMLSIELDHYLTTTLERFDNSFLDHRLEDIRPAPC